MRKSEGAKRSGWMLQTGQPTGRAVQWHRCPVLRQKCKKFVTNIFSNGNYKMEVVWKGYFKYSHWNSLTPCLIRKDWLLYISAWWFVYMTISYVLIYENNNFCLKFYVWRVHQTLLFSQIQISIATILVKLPHKHTCTCTHFFQHNLPQDIDIWVCLDEWKCTSRSFQKCIRFVLHEGIII